MAERISVRICYFAVFREQRGLSQETVETTAESAGDLYSELCMKYGFTLPASRVRVAINKEFQAMETALADGVEIAFVPPVAGG